MEDDARQLAQSRHQDDKSRLKRKHDWDNQAAEILVPLITEYAQSLARQKLSPEAMNASWWFRPNLVLVDRESLDDNPRASCQFQVNQDGSWTWLDRPSWHGLHEPDETISVEAIRATLTQLLSSAMRSAL